MQFCEGGIVEAVFILGIAHTGKSGKRVGGRGGRIEMQFSVSENGHGAGGSGTGEGVCLLYTSDAADE